MCSSTSFRTLTRFSIGWCAPFRRGHRTCCVVGDDDQSIYRWRGADVRIVRGFRRDFPGATVVKLEQNYRSTANIVRAALSVIKPAKDREPKELFTQNPSGEPISVVASDTEHDEAAYVVSASKASSVAEFPNEPSPSSTASTPSRAYSKKCFARRRSPIR